MLHTRATTLLSKLGKSAEEADELHEAYVRYITVGRGRLPKVEVLECSIPELADAMRDLGQLLQVARAPAPAVQKKKKSIDGGQTIAMASGSVDAPVERKPSRVTWQETQEETSTLLRSGSSILLVPKQAPPLSASANVTKDDITDKNRPGKGSKGKPVTTSMKK